MQPITGHEIRGGIEV